MHRLANCSNLHHLFINVWDDDTVPVTESPQVSHEGKSSLYSERFESIREVDIRLKLVSTNVHRAFADAIVLADSYRLVT